MYGTCSDRLLFVAVIQRYPIAVSPMSGRRVSSLFPHFPLMDAILMPWSYTTTLDKYPQLADSSAPYATKIDNVVRTRKASRNWWQLRKC